MKRKEVEDVMGGKDAWANVDKTDGMFARGDDSFPRDGVERAMNDNI